MRRSSWSVNRTPADLSRDAVALSSAISRASSSSSPYSPSLPSSLPDANGSSSDNSSSSSESNKPAHQQGNWSGTLPSNHAASALPTHRTGSSTASIPCASPGRTCCRAGSQTASHRTMQRQHGRWDQHNGACATHCHCGMRCACMHGLYAVPTSCQAEQSANSQPRRCAPARGCFVARACGVFANDDVMIAFCDRSVGVHCNVFYVVCSNFWMMLDESGQLKWQRPGFHSANSERVTSRPIPQVQVSYCRYKLCFGRFWDLVPHRVYRVPGGPALRLCAPREAAGTPC